MVPNTESNSGGPQGPSRDAGISNEKPADARVVAAWCRWLDALATDAEAALAAALAYRELDADGRQCWLSALEHDAGRLQVPLIAVYAPLLAVEHDLDRRQRIQAAMGSQAAAEGPVATPRGLVGDVDGTRVAVVILPLYLSFVQVLACGYRYGAGFEWVKHDPIVDKSQVPVQGERLEGAQLEPVPIKGLIDELAHVVLAHQRNGRKLPEALCALAELFAPAPDRVATAVGP